MADESLPTTEFCKNLNIDWFPINLTISGTDKKLNKIEHCLYNYSRPDLHDFSDKNLLKARQHLFRTQPELFTHLCIDTTNVFQIDIDNEDYEDAFDCIAGVSPWFPSMTKSYGKHIFCRYDGFVPSAKRMQFLNYGEPVGVELLCGFGSYAPFVIQNTGFPVYDLKLNTYKVTIDVPKQQQKQRQQNLKKEVPKTDNQFEKIKALCEIIDDKYICPKGCYEHWRNILWALRSESEDYKELAREMSNRKGANFDDGVFDSVWDSFKEGDFTIGTFYHYCQKSHEKMYDEIIAKYSEQLYISIEDLADIYKCCQIITPTLRKKVFFCKEKWWILNDETQLWGNPSEPCYNIVSEIRKYINYSHTKISKQIMVTEGLEKDRLISIQKQYSECFKKVNQPSYSSTCKQYLKALLLNNRFDEKLDKKIGFLAFENGIMNLKTGVFREGIQWEDYITNTIPYDYTPPNPSKSIELKGFLKQILNNNDEHLEYFLQVIGFTFLGMPHLEKSLYFMIDGTDNSKGNNGKTLFFDVLTTLMPNYVYKSKGTLLEENNPKIHKQLVNTKGKRMVWCDEFSRVKKLNSELMKELADGKTIENEVMFGTSETINIMFKMFILSNFMIKIDPEQTAVYNRYKQISFGSHFDQVGDLKEPIPEQLKFIADQTLADRLKNDYYNEIFALIIEYAQKYNGKIKIPAQFIGDAQIAQQKNDEFGMWFADNCIRSEEGRISLQKLEEISHFKKDTIIEGMARLGLKYKKDLYGLGLNTYTNKPYRGGFLKCSIVDNDAPENQFE